MHRNLIKIDYKIEIIYKINKDLIGWLLTFYKEKGY